MTAYAGLATRIARDMADLSRVVDRTRRVAEKAEATGDPDYLDGVALNLHAFYTGVERILESIAREVDRAVPEGPDWHRDLLLQMAGPVNRIRPTALREDTRACLEAYRGFRHVVRNIYAFSLDPVRVNRLAEELAECYRHVARDLGDFATFLNTLADEDA